VTHAIESVEGVRYASVSFMEKTAEVQSAQCTQPVFEALSKALDEAGYGSTVVRVQREPASLPPHPAPP
jgi:copper chaperone CopZ